VDDVFLIGRKTCAVALLFAGVALLGTTAATQAQVSALADPASRDEFCRAQFPDVMDWDRCLDMWPYAGTASAQDRTAWLKCESESKDTDGKLDEKKMATCLSPQMQRF